MWSVCRQEWFNDEVEEHSGEPNLVEGPAEELLLAGKAQAGRAAATSHSDITEEGEARCSILSSGEEGPVASQLSPAAEASPADKHQSGGTGQFKSGPR